MNQDCTQFEVQWDEKTRSGICTGITKETRTDKRICHMCLISRKPTANLRCEVKWQVHMTPAEAVMVGVSLIGVRVIGEALLRNQEAEIRRNQQNQSQSQNKSVSQ